MTMQVRVTNETPVPVAADTTTLVRVYDVPPENGNILPREDKAARALLAPGQSVTVEIHHDRFMMVDDATVLDKHKATP